MFTRRIRRKVSGTAERPRLAIHFSNKNVYAQLIDDISGKTIASASTKDEAVDSSKANAATALKVGQLIAERAKAKSPWKPWSSTAAVTSIMARSKPSPTPPVKAV